MGIDRTTVLGLLEYLPVAAVYTEGDSIFFNKVTEQLIGYTTQEIETLDTWFELLYPGCSDDVGKLYKADQLAGFPQSREITVRCKDGCIKYVEFKGNGADPAICILHDVTERVQIKKALEQSEERYRTLVEIAPDMVAIHGGGVFNYINAAGARMLGASSPEELVGYPAMDVVHPDFHDIVNTRVNDAEHKGVAAPYMEEQFVRLDGQVIDVEVASKPLLIDGKMQVLVIARDIAERRQMQQKLRDSEAMLQLYMKYSPIYSFIKDEQFRVVSLSSNFIDLIGIPAEQALGKGMEELFPSGFAEKIISDDQAVLLSGQVFEGDEDFGGRNYTTIKFPFELHGKKYLGGFTIDITERKQAEEERLELERKLLHSQKLESLGVLAGGIAHDFNNLLTIILGNLDMSLIQMHDEAPERENINYAVRACRRAADLVRQMLAYSGKGAFKVADVDLNRLVSENAELFRTTVPKTITFNICMAERLPLVTVDYSQIQQVIMNLITNAAEAIGESTGTISLTTGVQHCDEQMLRKNRCKEKAEPGNYVFFEVTDSGCGMDAETKLRIFEPFYTTKFAGRGLGMSAVLGIVKAHKGAIILESQKGKGTVFKVLLPVSSSVHEFAGTEEPVDNVLKTELSGTVLIVDDEPDIRAFCEFSLQHMGLNTLSASDGYAAVSIFSEYCNEISVVLLDLTMPQMDGFATLAALRRIRPNVKVIISTGHAAEDTRERFTEQVPDDIIQKPYHIQELWEKLGRVVKGR